MEGSLQKIIAAFVGVLILFIIPVYLAFEKVDDISYSLVLKLTQNFVDTARDKGYISPDMYNDYISNLMATKNIYDVEIEHVRKRNDPAIYIYELVVNEDGNKEAGAVLYTLDYDKYVTDAGTVPTQIVIDDVTYTTNVNCKIESAHSINQEIITDNQIVNKIFKDTGITKQEFINDCITGNSDMYKSLAYLNENSYMLNTGDQINVTVRNRSQTIASIFYSLFTANVSGEEVAKIFVNYGGNVKNDGAGTITSENGRVDSEMGRIFRYRGIAEEVNLAKGKYSIECWGASGGGATLDDGTSTGGKGAYVKGYFEVTEETIFYVYVGGKGTEYSETNENNGGYNGGGSSYKGYGGGGASDVRLVKGTWDDTTSLLSRIIVAAGGGGSSKATDTNQYGKGGNGGNLSSGENGSVINDASADYNLAGKGASISLMTVINVANEIVYGDESINIIPESEGGSLGLGGTGDYDGAGGGGSGYFGGSAAHGTYAGGGGGVSYIYDFITNTRNSKLYPFKSPITNVDTGLSTSELEKTDFLLNNGKFKVLNKINNMTEYINETKSGNSVPTVTGVTTDGNGLVRIIKVD